MMIRSLFLMFMMMMAGTSLVGCDSQNAKSVEPCPMGEVPVQMIRIRADPVTPLSEARIESTVPGFSVFATTIIDHLAVKLARENLCLKSDESRERSLIQFAPRPGNSGRDPLASVPPLSGRSSGVCRITSPWMELVVERKPVPSVRAIFIYSVRQLLADQAVLAGARDVPPGVAMPLSYEEFRRYVKEYTLSEVSGEPAEKPIEELHGSSNENTLRGLHADRH